MVLQAPAQPTTVEAPPAHPDAPSPGQRPEPSTERRSLRRRLRAPAIATVVVQAVLAMGDRMPSVDATAYFATGRNVLEGAGYTRHGAPEMHFPPVAPIGYALGERLLGSEMAALRVLHLTAGLACVVLLVALAKLLSEDDDVVVATAWLATTVGGLVCLAIRGGSGSELLTVDLLLGAALVALGGPARASMSGGRLAGRAAAVGALVGIAYLTRPEALVPGLLLGLPATHVRHQPRRTLVGLAAFAVVLGALVAPYVAFQHAHTGSWALTSKSQDASIEAWRSVAEGDRRARDEVLYAIDDTGTGLGSETRSLTTLAREDPAGWLGIVATNAATIGRWYLLAQLLPLFLLLPALRQLWVTRHRRTTRVLAAVAATPLVTCLAFFTLPRYLLLTTAILIPFGAWGLVDLLAGRSPLVRRRWWTTIGVLAGISLLVGAYPLLPSSPAAERTDPQAIGEWLAANTPDDARVMTRSFHVQAYAEREVVALPYAEWDEVEAFARRMGVTHLVADELTIVRRRPELADDLLGDEPPDGLTLVHELTEHGRTTRVYAFTPAPPPSDEPPIYLGYVSD